MAEVWVKAQVTFTASLMGDGSLLIMEHGMFRSEAGAEPLTYFADHEPEGSCDPEEIAYILWMEMERHI